MGLYLMLMGLFKSYNLSVHQQTKYNITDFSDFIGGFHKKSFFQSASENNHNLLEELGEGVL